MGFARLRLAGWLFLASPVGYSHTSGLRLDVSRICTKLSLFPLCLSFGEHS